MRKVKSKTDDSISVTPADLVEIRVVFNSLLKDVSDVLDKEFNRNRIDRELYAMIVLESIKNSQRLAVEYVSNEAKNTAEVALINNQAVSEEKKALDIASSTSVRDAQSAQDILNKAAQLALINNQAVSEEKKALDIASSTSVRDAQSAQDILNKAAQLALINRQGVGFDDKLRVEAMKSMSGVAQMEATNVGTSKATLTALKKTINEVYKAAGETGDVI